MKKRRDKPLDAADLRGRAEARLGERKKGEAARPGTKEATQRLVHELQVHQIELEMQNEELQQARREVEWGLEQYTDLYDSAPVGYFTLTHDGMIRQVNLTGVRLLGAERSRLVNRRFGLFVSDESRPAFNAFLKKAFESRASVTCEVALRTEGEEPLWARIEARCSEDGQECRAAVVDITTRKQAEEALRTSEEHFRALLESSSDVITVLDSHGIVLYQSQNYKSVWGRDPESEIGKNVFKDVHPDDVSSVRDAFARLLQNPRDPIQLQVRAQHTDGTWRTLDVVARNLLESPSVRGIVMNFRDITDRERVEDALRESEERFRLVFENAYDGISIFEESPDPKQRRLVECNARYAEMAGRNREELIGIGNTLELARTLSEDNTQSIEQAVPFRGSFSWNRPDGKDNIIEYTAVPIRMQGKTYTIGIDRDITERKRTEEHISRLNRLYAVLGHINQTIVRARDRNAMFGEICRVAVEIGKFRMAWVGLVEADERMVQLVASSGVVDGYLTGIRITVRDEPEGRGPTGTAIREGKIIICNDVASDAGMKPWRERMLQRGYRSSAAVPIRLGGRVIGAFNVYANEVGFFDRGETQLLEEIGGDITHALDAIEQEEKRKRAEEELQESERKLKEAQRLGRIGHWEYDVHTQQIHWSDMVFDLYQRDPKLGPPTAEEEASYYSPEDARRLRDCARRTIETGEPYEIDVRLRLPGGRVADAATTGTPVKDARGRVVRLLGTIQDITERKRAEEALRESERRYQTLAEISPVGIFRTDSEGRTSYVNRRWCEITGLASSEALGYGWLPAVHPEDRESIESGWKEATRDQGGVKAEYRFMRPDGTVTWVIGQAIPEKNDKGEVVAFIGTLTEITERKQAEEKLRVSDEIIKKVNSLILIADANGRITYASPSVKTILGYETAEVLGDGWWLSTREDCREREEARMQAARAARAEIPLTEGPYEAKLRSKDGETHWILWQDARGVHQELIGVGQDITERKRAEEALSKERSLLRALMDNVPDHIYFKDINSRFITISKAQADRFGLSDPTQALGKTDFDFFTEEHARPAFEDEQKIIKTGRPIVGVEEKETWPDGRETWVSTTKVPLRDTEGQIIGTFGISRDITERKRMEEALRENEQRLKVALTCADIAVFNQDKDLRYTWMFNPQLGFLPEEVIGKSDKDLFSRADVSTLINIKQKVLETGVGAHEEVLMTLDHQEIVVLLNVEPLRDSSGAIIGLTGAKIDITQRKLAELEVRRNREWLQAILDASRDGILAEKDETIAYANTSFARIHGYDDPAELIGKHVTMVLAPEERRRLMDFGKRRLLGESMPNAYEFKGIRKDGKAVQLEASVSTALVAGEGYIISTVRDISERKSLQKQLIEAQKMESIGTLAGGIAHDFNNILGIIMGHSSLLERARENPEKFARSADAISKATFRGAGLVRQLLTFARKTDVAMQSVLVNDTLSELAKLLEEILPKTIVLELKLGERLPSIHGDPTQLHQVFLNLCVNARDAMTPKGGRLTLTSRLVSGEVVSMKFSRADAMEYIVVDASDTGAGMDEVTRARIFEPFFTTKGKGKGTGLGLATVYGIIESHRGFIDVESTLGVGSTFHVYLPVEPRHVKPQEVARAAEKEIPGGTETILVVEDEETLRGLICFVLEGKGYTVLQASDGDEGLQQFTEHQQEIALVLSDLGLPKMSGEDLFNRIRELKPEAKIILASGYVEPGMKSELLKGGAKEIIQKPYVPVDVLKKIREVLDSKQ